MMYDDEMMDANLVLKSLDMVYGGMATCVRGRKTCVMG